MAYSFRVFHALQLAYSGVFGTADKLLKQQEGIISAHQVILYILAAEDGLPISAVAKRVGMSKSRLTSLADTLEDKGLLRRLRGEDDARQLVLFLEPEGRALVHRTKRWVMDMNAVLLEDFDDGERKAIQRFLKKAADMRK